ncbi:hypothetical protein TRFO_24537 [Tritrichomonas foetus]|uniref:Uncharacterized protein n=1 Tax=Tritrichomonas foetus TaxID=1144522 RepID=A0A1J4KD32_9EUKA|nr:hypothetical protein TRFO_24537 [Tritrichomonas foetus]|eukprot:OHT07349.1 hypothetical protein TRFO_24537 [Tritrichomonas foetus]
MANRYGEEEPQEFHFGEWSTSSDSNSQYDSDTICPISLNDLAKFDDKASSSPTEETDFVVPSLTKAIENRNSKEVFSVEDSHHKISHDDPKLPFDFTQKTTVLGLESTITFDTQSESESESLKSNPPTKKKIEDNNASKQEDCKILSFTALVKDDEAFLKLQNGFSSSSSDSDFLVVTNEEVLAPDSDSSTEAAFEEFRSSQNSQMKSQISFNKINKSNLSNSNNSNVSTITNVSNDFLEEKSESMSSISRPKSCPPSSSKLETSNSQKCSKELTFLSDEDSESADVEIENSNSENYENENDNSIVSDSNIYKSDSLISNSSYLSDSIHNNRSKNSQNFNQCTNKSINRRINQSMNKNLTKSSNESVNETINQSINSSFNERMNVSVNKSVDKSISYEVNQSIKEFMSKQTKNSMNSSINKSKNINNNKSITKSTNILEYSQNYDSDDSDARNKSMLSDSLDNSLNNGSNKQNIKIMLSTSSDSDSEPMKVVVQQPNKKAINASFGMRSSEIEAMESNTNHIIAPLSGFLKKNNKSSKQSNLHLINQSRQKNQSKPKINNLNKNFVENDVEEYENDILPDFESSSSSVKFQKEVFDCKPSIEQSKMLENSLKEENDSLNEEVLNENKVTRPASTPPEIPLPSKVKSPLKQPTKSVIHYASEPQYPTIPSILPSNIPSYPIIPNINEIPAEILAAAIPKMTILPKDDEKGTSDVGFESDDVQSEDVPDISFASAIDEKPIQEEKDAFLQSIYKGYEFIPETSCVKPQKTEYGKPHLNSSESESNSYSSSDKDDDEDKWFDDDIDNPSPISTPMKSAKTKSQIKNPKQKINKDNKNVVKKENDEITMKEDVELPQMNEEFIDTDALFEIKRQEKVNKTFYEIICEPMNPTSHCISLVITINSLLNIPPQSGVTNLDLYVTFSDETCSPITINLKKAGFRSGKYEAKDAQYLFHFPITSLLVLSFELLGDGKRLCGSNISLIDQKLISSGKHYLKLLQRPTLHCETKKGDKDPIIELSISKLTDKDEGQVQILPDYSIVPVFFVDSVVAYKQLINHALTQKSSNYEKLTFFTVTLCDMENMKRFAKVFNDSMHKLPKEKRNDKTKLKVFLDILQKEPLIGHQRDPPFSTNDLSILNVTELPFLNPLSQL